MTDYWIKLYTEILDDPKVATMPDRLWRRMVELFVLTGKLNGVNKSGELPEAKQIAWALRVQVDEIELDLVQLANVGIIQKIPTGWVVVNFAKRQAAVSDAERMKASRDRKHREQYYSYEPVTICNTETDTDTDTESDRGLSIKEVVADTKNTATADPFTTYHQNIGMITSAIKDKIIEAEHEYTRLWVNEAILEATLANVRRWNYIESILKRWATEGYKSAKPKGNGRYQEKGMLVKDVIIFHAGDQYE
jgi:DnaD/phage-associated family protein